MFRPDEANRQLANFEVQVRSKQFIKNEIELLQSIIEKLMGNISLKGRMRLGI